MADDFFAIASARAGRPPRFTIRGGQGDNEVYDAAAAHDQAQVLAARLTRLGARCVALHADNSPRWLLVDLACQMANMPFVPLPLYFSANQIEHTLRTCAADLLLSERPDFIARFLPGGRQLEPIAGYQAGYRPSAQTPALPEGTRKITFTSGSTGEPKGVCLGAAQQWAVAGALVDAVAITGVRHLCVLHLTTLLENIAGAYAPMFAGGEVTVPSLAEIGFTGGATLDRQRFLQAVACYQPQSLILFPQLLQLFLSAIKQGYKPPASLRFIAVGGAKVAPALLSEAAELGLPVFEGYGLSECASVVSLNLPGRNRPGSAGQVLPIHRLRLADDGIALSGNHFLGYAGEPASWYPSGVTTGDLGKLDADGYLHLEGRGKNVLISSFGRNISPEWVEAELLAHPAIIQAVVVGDGEPCCGALVFALDESLDDRALDTWLTEVNLRLPDYAKVRRWRRLPPSTLHEHALLTANGRLRRRALLEALAADIQSLYALEKTGNDL